MIDIAVESVRSLRDAAKLLPSIRLGRPVTFQCVFRWVVEGCRGPDGQIVRLEAVRLGGRWVTSMEALQRFAEALTPRLPRSLQAPPAVPTQPKFPEVETTSSPAPPVPARRRRHSVGESMAVLQTD
jgi:hypothetical protein